jgi:integration host factor subunit beta
LRKAAVSKFTRADIIDAIYNKTGTNRKEIRNLVDLFIEEVKTALVSHKVIELRGFGTFEVKIRKGRQKARNPKTGEILSVNSHGIVHFRAGRELKQDVWTLVPDVNK